MKRNFQNISKSNETLKSEDIFKNLNLPSEKSFENALECLSHLSIALKLVDDEEKFSITSTSSPYIAHSSTSFSSLKQLCNKSSFQNILVNKKFGNFNV